MDTNNNFSKSEVQRLKKSYNKFKALSNLGAISFLDILGWKGIWARDKSAIEKLENLSRSIEINATKETKGKTYGNDNLLSLDTNIKIISDTIVIITKAEKEIASESIELHGKLIKSAIIESIKKGIPIRGATCFGEYSISSNNNILVGKAVDEAASWYEQANWIGVFMTPSASFHFNNSSSENWIEYDIPFKNKISFKTSAINWLSDEYNIIEIKDYFTLMNPILPEFIDKFQNTIEFLSHDHKSKK